MVTHQALGGSTDEEFLQRLARTYPERFGEAFWAFFTTNVAPHLPPRPVMLDLGCGPGLFLRDLREALSAGDALRVRHHPRYDCLWPAASIHRRQTNTSTARHSNAALAARRWDGAYGEHVIGPAHLRRAPACARRDSAGSGTWWPVYTQRLDPSASAYLSDAAYGGYAGRTGRQLTARLSSLSSA